MKNRPAMLKRRRTDFLLHRIDELERRLQEMSRLAHIEDASLDEERKAILAALPHYKEALRLESSKRAKRGKGSLSVS